VNIGDKVQVKYIDNGTQETRESTERAGKVYQREHWLYADVLGMPRKNKLRVRVEHPANPWHGRELIVGPGEYRTIEDVAALIDEAERQLERKRNPSAADKDKVRGLKVELKRLGTKGKIAA
jgi:hypothetical protein